ncbi:NAD-dependent epimerase/dehydratase family protein [Cohnella luojiensis]|uniref:NAD-dependent epimerase/dehydratase family protein n=1 Tax=Cohnella luojiensis TaxID=652876 RepID=A0A4Y8M4A1_9BACL|nr:NAD-dependent epimerase/dehydratase family protein [Cohnella luojiensis]TFE29006.1 NAD-dependent epimerase/dehydratase family protein [Cohnella luojiensis]
MKNVFLLGGGGFIGTNLARFLLENELNVTVYGRGNSKVFDGIHYIQGELSQQKDFEVLLMGQDAVIHLISTVSPASSMSDFLAPYQVDVIKTIEILEACRKLDIKKVIFISSGGTVYGTSKETKLIEESNTNPINNYGIAKLTIEKICLMYNEVYGMENVILRVANPYGVGQDPAKKVGAISVFYSNIINKVPISIYGDGETTRDYVEISDVIRAIYQALYYKVKKDCVPVFNIATGVGTSLNEIINEIQSVLGERAIINYIGERSIDVSHNVLDITKAQRELGYEVYYNFANGLRKFIDSSIGVT